MKKLAKYLVLFFVVAALAGVFAFSVFADTPATASATVGQYTAPTGAWTPADDSVYFAVWSTEADYLAGNVTPNVTGTTNVITQDDVGGKDSETKTFYVVLFKNCTIDKVQLVIGQHHTVTFNLGGKTLDVPSGMKPGNASSTVTTGTFTVKNGTFNHNGGNMQFRINAVGYYENVVYNVKGACMNYDAGAKSITFKDCILNVNGNGDFRVSVNKDRVPTEYNFINTDVVMGEASTAPLFCINAAAAAVTGEGVLNIRFDKDSSVTRVNNVPLLTLNKQFPYVESSKGETWPEISATKPDIPAYLDQPANLIFEAGCVLSENIAPVEGEAYAYRVIHWSMSSGKYGPDNGAANADAIYDAYIKNGFTDGQIAVKVVAPGTNNLISWTNEAANGGVALTVKASEGWTPDAAHAGITWGMWATEADFLAGNAPVKFSTKATISTIDIGYLNNNATNTPDFVPGYIRLFNDIKSINVNKTAEGTAAGVANDCSQIIIGQTQYLTLDLNGYTYTDAVGIRIGASSASHPQAGLTVKNGVFLRKGGQIHARADVQVIFDNVAFIVDAGGQTIFYGPQADLVKFVDSKLLVFSGVGFGTNTAGTSAGLARGQYVFENTDIEYARVAPTAPIFNFTNNKYAKKALYDIIFDENSSIKGDFTAAGLVGMVNTLEDGSFDVKVYTELGFQFARTAAPTFNCTYTPVGGTAATLAGTAEDGASFNWSVVAPDTTIAITDFQETVVTSGYYNAMSAYDSMGNLADKYQFVELDAAGNILNTWPIGSTLANNTGSGFQNTNGSTIKFFHDTVIENGFGTYGANNITFDLNGCTVKYVGNARFQIGHSMSGQWKERVVKFIDSSDEKGGVLDLTGYTNSSNYVFQNRPGSIIEFSDIDINMSYSMFTEYGAKSVLFDNVHFINTNQKQHYILAGGYDKATSTNYSDKGGVREFTFNNCIFDEQIYAARWTHNTYDNNGVAVNYNDKIKVNVTGGTVLANGYAAPFTISGLGVQQIEFNIAADTKYTSFGSQVCYLEKGVANINMNGYEIKALKQVGDYFETVDYPTLNAGDLKANLTLFADFKVNFFANPEKITAIYTANKTLLESETFGGSAKYTARFSAHEAADDQVFTVAVVVGNETVYANLAYSVAKYADALALADVSDDAKLLVSTAMNYVAEAYMYAGKDASNVNVGDLADYDWSESTTDAQLTSAIKGVQLNLDSGFKLRFNVADDYNGTLVINGVSYEVVDGNFNGIDYVNVELRAFELYDAVIEIVAGEETGCYSLADYCAFAAESDDENLAYLVEALYDYCGIAAEYKIAHPNLD